MTPSDPPRKQHPDPGTPDPGRGDARTPDPRNDAGRDADRDAEFDCVEEAGEESFPASDPPSWTGGTSGPATRRAGDDEASEKEKKTGADGDPGDTPG